MKKKILPILVLSLILTLLNSMMLIFLTANKISENGGIEIGIKSNKPVVISKQYDKGQSLTKAINTGKPMIVWFYTDWCRYCQKFAPTFKKVTTDRDIKKSFAVAYVNAEDFENKDYVKEYDIKGYPTVFLVNGDKKELVPSQWLFQDDAAKKLKQNFLAFLR